MYSEEEYERYTVSLLDNGKAVWHPADDRSEQERHQDINRQEIKNLLTTIRANSGCVNRVIESAEKENGKRAFPPFKIYRKTTNLLASKDVRRFGGRPDNDIRR